MFQQLNPGTRGPLGGYPNFSQAPQSYPRMGVGNPGASYGSPSPAMFQGAGPDGGMRSPAGYATPGWAGGRGTPLSNPASKGPMYSPPRPSPASPSMPQDSPGIGTGSTPGMPGASAALPSRPMPQTQQGWGPSQNGALPNPLLSRPMPGMQPAGQPGSQPGWGQPQNGVMPDPQFTRPMPGQQTALPGTAGQGGMPGMPGMRPPMGGMPQPQFQSWGQGQQAQQGPLGQPRRFMA